MRAALEFLVKEITVDRVLILVLLPAVVVVALMPLAVTQPLVLLAMVALVKHLQ